MTIRISRGAAIRATLLGLALAGATPFPAAARPTASPPPQDSLTLAQAIARAQQQSHAAVAARDTRDAARYRHGAFTARLLPQLSLGGTVPAYNRSIIPVLQPDGSTLFLPQQQTNAALTMTLSQQLPLTGGNLFVASSLSRLTVRGQTSFEQWSSVPVTVGVRQDLFRPNTARWDQKEEGVRAELGERQYLEAMEDVALQTTQAFFDAYAAREGLENAITNAAVNETLYTLNTGRFQVGKIGENDLLQSELALLRARTAVQGARLENDRALDALRLALHLPPGATIELVVPREVPAVNADTARAVAEAERNRAAVSEAALQEVTARRRVAEAQLASGIGATVLASFGFNATAPQARLAYENLLEARQFSLSVQLPVWQWGARSDNVAAARADRDRVSTLSQGTLEQVAHDAHFAVLQLQQAERTVALLAKADTVAGKRFEVAYNRYVIGRITVDNLYIAQSEKDQALGQFVQALRGYWLAYYQLRRTTLFDFESGRPIRRPF